MADYYQLKNQSIFNPPANTALGTASNQFASAYIQDELVLGSVAVTGTTINTPKISTITYPGDDTAADTAGGQTITLTGSGFVSGASVLINNVAASIVTVVNSTTITFTTPANNTGSYVVYVINPDGGTAVAIPGIQYSGTPTWTTAAGSLGGVYETANFNSTVAATGDSAITYSVVSGTLPPGATFNSNGTITGTSQTLSSPTTYTFTVKASDAQNQDTSRSFSITINPDVVTWTSPANNTTYSSNTDIAISNITLNATSAAGASVAYTANSLPTGISLSGNTISGIPTGESTSSTVLTASAASTGESAALTINWVITVASDQHFKNLSLVVPGASTTFVDDASTNNLAISVFGDTKPTNFSPYTAGYYSNYFDGSGDSIQAPSGACISGTGDFTAECWIYPTVVPATYNIIGCSDASSGLTMFGLNANGTIFMGRSLIDVEATSSNAVNYNAWNHIAVSRSSGTVKIFVNGVQGYSGSITTSYSSGTVRIGTDGGGSALPYTGYISNYRIIQGSALYTSAFTPSTTPLTPVTGTSLLTCQSNRFIDNSTNNFTITRNGDVKINGFDSFVPNTSYSTYGSTYLDGTGDNIQVPYSATLAAGTGAYSFEAWVYFTGSGASQGVIGTTSDGFCGFERSNGNWAYYHGTSGIPTAVPAVINQWNHVVICRNASGAGAFFVNGTRLATFTDTANKSGFGNLQIGYNGVAGGSYTTGYIADYRYVKGNPYNPTLTTLTVPTEPLTAIENTVVLILRNNQPVNNGTFLDSSSTNTLITRTGNVTQGSISPYGGGWSNYFDGTGDVLVPTANAAFALGTGAFCIEAWMYNNTLKNYSCLVTTRPNNGSHADAYHIGWDSAGGISLYVNTTSRASGAAGSIKVGVWQHIVCCRNSSGVVSIFVDGVRVGTETVTTDFTKNLLGIGDFPTTQAENISGYISNLRIVKGDSVYNPTQTTLTVPTAPLQPIAGTSLLTCCDNRFVDDSANNFTLTRTGDVRVEKFNPFGILTSPAPITYSTYFDGSGDYLTFPNNSNIPFGTGSFTIEFWINGALNNDKFILGGRSAIDGSFHITTGGYNSTAGVLRYNGSSQIVSSNLITDGAWHHVAIVRNGSSNITIYVDGVSSGTGTDTTNYTGTTGTWVIGANDFNYPNNVGSSHLNAYLSNIRIVKGTALYTSNFTVPTSPLTAISGTQLLVCQSNILIDNSTNNLTITASGNVTPSQTNPFGYTAGTKAAYSPAVYGGSAYFDASLDYLNAGVNSAYSFGSENFTIESWVYITARGSSGSCFAGTWAASGRGWIWISTPTQHGFVYSTNGTNETAILSTYTIPLNTWTHLATVRDGNTITNYANGVSIGTGSVTGVTISTPTQPLYIGANKQDVDSSLNNYQMTGYMSDFRVVKGIAVYKSAFTPPITPLTAVQNSSLLLNMTGAAIYDASMINNMETVGDAKLSTAVSKFGGSSIFFDGSGDNLSIADNPTIELGSTNFTIEGWFYWTANTTNWCLFNKSNSYELKSDSNRWVWQLNASTNAFVTGWAPTLSTWYHIALVRNGATTSLYIDGSLYTSGSSTNVNDNTSVLTIGSGAGGTFTGYIQDFRITKGIARYTGNFTPPTKSAALF